MRRRLRVGETAPATAAPVDYLNLSADPAATPRANPIPEKPVARGRVQLTLTSPVVRLTPRQSAIGSMTISGAESVYWETDEGLDGVLEPAQSADRMPRFANRPLVEWSRDTLVVGLRHSKVLRRIIVGAPTGTLTATLNDGTVVEVDTREGKDLLYLSVIGSQLEARVESLDADGDLAKTFGIVL